MLGSGSTEASWAPYIYPHIDHLKLRPQLSPSSCGLHVELISSSAHIEYKHIILYKESALSYWNWLTLTRWLVAVKMQLDLALVSTKSRRLHLNSRQWVAWVPHGVVELENAFPPPHDAQCSWSSIFRCIIVLIYWIIFSLVGRCSTPPWRNFCAPWQYLEVFGWVLSLVTAACHSSSPSSQHEGSKFFPQVLPQIQLSSWFPPFACKDILSTNCSSFHIVDPQCSS